MPVGWLPFSPPGDFWIIVKGELVFESGDPIDLGKLDLDTLPLVFDFPLSVNQSWCPVQIDLKDPNHAPITNCDYAGKLTVLHHSAHEVPAGSFTDCFQINQCTNDGCELQWFCKGIGVVDVKYDHSGTRFGFTQELTGYSKGP